MALFDKLNDFAKNLSERTNDVIETGKLSSKVNQEKNLAGEELKKIGHYFYTLWLEGAETVPEILEYCEAAKAHFDASAEAQAEIDRMRAEAEAARAAAAAAAAPPTPTGNSCPNCGAINGPGMKFCSSCGTKLAADSVRYCPGCGAELPPGTRFCGGCGAALGN